VVLFTYIDLSYSILLQNRLSVQEDKLDTVEARHQLDKEELSALSATLEILSQKIETVQGENYEYKQKIEELKTGHQTEKADWDVTLDELAKVCLRHSIYSRLLLESLRFGVCASGE